MTYSLKLHMKDGETKMMGDVLQIEEAAFYVARLHFNYSGITKVTIINNDTKECREYNNITLPVVHAIAKQDEDYTKDALKFRVEGVPGDVSLFQDKEKKGDGIYWGLQHGSMLKSYYSPEDIAHSKRMQEIAPIKDGELVIIAGEIYRCKVNGNYSDCCVFEKVGD